MDFPQAGKTAGKPRILVAPLDWGLGHATRCMPIVRELLSQGAEVMLAGEGAQEQLLKAEFPGLPFLSLPGYKINYAKTARGLAWKMIGQGLKMKRAIRYEHQWLQWAVHEYALDAVISDNRYGLYHKNVLTVFITHQLTIRSPWGKWTEKILQKRNYRYINKFTECWVPDLEGPDNLAGKLSHPLRKPGIPIKYIGWLTRFKKTGVKEKENHLLFILSGPEPQRTILENKIIEEVSRYNGTAVIARGLPGDSSILPSTNMIRFHNHLSADELNAGMEQAAFIISRSGYSTVMDAAALGKKCIFIPTPGQTEQEYLGQYLSQKGLAVVAAQDKFSLSSALATARQFNYQSFTAPGKNLLGETVSTLLAQLAAPALG